MTWGEMRSIGKMRCDGLNRDGTGYAKRKIKGKEMKVKKIDEKGRK